MKASGKSVDLGLLQSSLETHTKTLKAATTTLQRAQDAFARAESEYVVAQKAMAAGVEQVRAATKVL